MLYLITPYMELEEELPLLGKRIGWGMAPHIVVSLAYFFVEWKVALVVAAWWWPTMILGH